MRGSGTDAVSGKQRHLLSNAANADSMESDRLHC
jgi:hypothetical protein